MIKVFFFDLGHTIVKEINKKEKLESLLRDYGINYRRFKFFWNSFYYLRSAGRISSDEDMLFLLKRALKREDIPFEKIKKIIIYESYIIPKENIEAVKKIRRKYKTGLITNFVYEWMKEDPYFKVEDLFDAVFVSSKTKARKPDARIFYKALKLFSIKPEEAFFVSNSISTDLITAKGCGMKTIWLNNNTTREKKMSEFFCPDVVIKDFSEITEIVKKL